MLSSDLIDAVFETITKIATMMPRDLIPVPEASEEVDEDSIEKIKSENEINEKYNAKILKMKNKIKIQKPEVIYNTANETALLKLNN